jgi:pimeloyl-ACP methyl ester carboxylesterase
MRNSRISAPPPVASGGGWVVSCRGGADADDHRQRPALPYLPALTAAGYRVLTFEDFSPAPSVGAVAAQLAGLLDHLGLGPVRAFGHAQGAHILQELALARPDRVRAAVLLGTWGRLPAVARLFNEAMVALTQGPRRPPPVVEVLLLVLGQFPPPMLADDHLMQPTIEAMLAAPRSHRSTRSCYGRAVWPHSAMTTGSRRSRTSGYPVW